METGIAAPARHRPVHEALEKSRTRMQAVNFFARKLARLPK